MLKGVQLLLFVPYANKESDWDEHTQKARIFFNTLGIAVLGIHQLPANRLPAEIEATAAIFIDGDNIFQLYKELKQRNLLSVISGSVLSGKMRYIGSGAGTKIACKALRTIDGMDSFYRNSQFEGLDIFPYQIELDNTGNK